MATAIGQYAGVTAVKLRLKIDPPDTADDGLLGTLCNQINGWVESYTERVLWPFSYVDELFDGLPFPRGNVIRERELMLPNGIRSVSSLELAATTAAVFTAVPAEDIFLRPNNRAPGVLADRLVLSDNPTGSYATFPLGMDNIRLNGDGGPEIAPDEVVGVAETAVVRAWHARQAGQSDIVGVDEMGAPLVSRYVGAEDKATLRRYRLLVVS